MRTKLIQKQIDNGVLDSAIYDESSDMYFLKQKKTIKLEVNKVYIVELDDSIASDVTLRDNWNKGKSPVYRYLKIDINKIVGKMVYCFGIGFDPETHKDLGVWTGYLPKDKITVISEL